MAAVIEIIHPDIRATCGDQYLLRIGSFKNGHPCVVSRRYS